MLERRRWLQSPVNLSVPIIVAVTCAALFGALWLWHSVRQSRLALRSGPATEADFVALLPNEPPMVAKAVYRWLHQGRPGDWTILPSDSLAEIHGLSDEDLDDAVLELLRECGRARPGPLELARSPAVRTVADLVGLVGRAPEE